MKPTIGRIVHYKLSEMDVESISAERSRSNGVLHGNSPRQGHVYPAMIVGENGGSAHIQLQVFLDGNDTYWATSRACGDTEGSWAWPQREA